MTVGKTTIAGILLIQLILLANAQAQTELADLQYESAMAAYDAEDCINASLHVSMAHDVYNAEGDQVGTAKCNDLIKKVNDCLRPTGDNQYLDALDYRFRGDQYLNSGDYESARERFDSALAHLLKANNTFQHMLPRDMERIAKVNTQYLQVSEKLKESELMKADAYYNKALDIIADVDYNQYTTAISYLRNASAIYQSYGEDESVQNCETLSKKITNTGCPPCDPAQYVYEKGIVEYQKANCGNDGFFEALDYFESAKNRYVLENNYEGAENCETIIEMTKEKIGECVDEILKTADEAKRVLLLPPETLDCGSRYNHTMGYYNTLIEDIQKIKEKIKETYEITGNESLKEKIQELNTLIEKIEQKKEECTRVEGADKTYWEAYELFQQAEYEQALEQIEQAEKEYGEIQDYRGVTKCEQLKDEIQEKLDKKHEAEEYYNKSLQYYKAVDYENALNYALKAKEIYENISKHKETEKCNETIEDIQKANETKKQADQYYEDALKCYEYRDYGMALENAEKARDLYKKIGYSEGIEKTETILVGYDPQPLIPIPYWSPEFSFVFILSVTAALIVWDRKVRQKKQEENFPWNKKY